MLSAILFERNNNYIHYVHTGERQNSYKHSFTPDQEIPDVPFSCFKPDCANFYCVATPVMLRCNIRSCSIAMATSQLNVKPERVKCWKALKGYITFAVMN